MFCELCFSYFNYYQSFVDFIAHTSFQICHWWTLLFIFNFISVFGDLCCSYFISLLSYVDCVNRHIAFCTAAYKQQTCRLLSSGNFATLIQSDSLAGRKIFFIARITSSSHFLAVILDVRLCRSSRPPASPPTPSPLPPAAEVKRQLILIVRIKKHVLSTS